MVNRVNENKSLLSSFELISIPFPPAASGIDIEEKDKLFLPKSWKQKVEGYIDHLKSGTGPKAFPIIGKYGSGKSVLLKYLKGMFQEMGIHPFLFDNPGVQFYDLANFLMRKVGRYEFAKSLFELAKPYLQEVHPQLKLIPMIFSEWLSNLSKKSDRETQAGELQNLIRDKLKITTDEEIAYRLSLIVVETAAKPYFEYRDFVAGKKESLVAEGVEAPYFRALISTLMRLYKYRGISFLIDEFEEVALYRRIPKRHAHQYLATLRRLINISERENLWIVISMTPEASYSTETLDPALWDRFTKTETYKFELDPLKPQEARDLLIWWLDRERPDKSDKRGTLFPFPNSIVGHLKEPELRYPRPLVKIGFTLLSEGQKRKEKVPFSDSFVKETIQSMYPSQNMGNQSGK